MKLPPDFRDLLEEFGRAGVEFVIVGAYAVAFHVRPRATKDLDIVLHGDDENLARAAEALARFGAPSNVVHATRTLAPTEVVYLGQEPLRIDLLRAIEGVDSGALFERAVAGEWDGVAIRVISFDDLVANKKAVGRKQDLADVELLERARAARARQ
jgi:predicted nucleotidyltransferase